MFKSKFTIVVVIILTICLILAVYIVFNNIEINSNINDTNDEETILIQDENGKTHLTNVSHTHGEFSASSPG